MNSIHQCSALTITMCALCRISYNTLCKIAYSTQIRSFFVLGKRIMEAEIKMCTVLNCRSRMRTDTETGSKYAL